MASIQFRLFLLPTALLAFSVLFAADIRPALAEENADAKSVEQLATELKPSLVTISTKGRDGKYQGVGTGFVIDADGLIVTNLHVIGD